MNISKEALRELYKTLDEEMRTSFDRSLPFDEYLFDRFERASCLSAGQGTSIHHSCYVYGKPTIGERSWIGPFSILDGSGGLVIGNNCSISAGVHIYTHDSVDKRLSEGRKAIEKSSVEIGDSCYIGPQSIISRGVKLGARCIVGSNSFVSKSFPDNSVLFGSPAVLRGKVILHDDGGVGIQWLPKDNPEDKLLQLEKKIRDLERRIEEIEKI